MRVVTDYFSQIDQDGAIDIIQYSQSKRTLNIHYNQRKSDSSNLCGLKSVAVTG